MAVNQIIGTVLGDNIKGSGSDDIFYGLDGNDIFDGQGGDDIVYGGNGNDGLNGDMAFFVNNPHGNSGNDILYGEQGDDSLYTLGGSDRLFGGEGNDYLNAVNRVDGAIGALLLDGGAGNDELHYAGLGAGDSAVLRGGDGDDQISVRSAITASIDAGAGADRLSLDLTSGQIGVTLGAGQDIITDLIIGSYVYQADRVGNIVIEDFEVGPAGDSILFDSLLDLAVPRWGGVNPFGNGILRLVQSGADTLVKFVIDSRYALPSGDLTLLTLRNVTASALTQENLGFALDGGVTAGLTLNGLAGSDTLWGAGGADHISGFGGADSLKGMAGNDVIDGGAGADVIDGGQGDDILHGGDGDDTLWDYAGSGSFYGDGGNDSIEIFHDLFDVEGAIVLLDGGDGDDRLSYGANQLYTDQVTVNGGAGDDTIFVASAARMDINAGSGNDAVRVDILVGPVTVTLGAGADRLGLFQNHNPRQGQLTPVHVTDFNVAAGDTLDITGALTSGVLNWNGVTNPFLTGHLRIAQRGTDAVVQIDRTGGGDNFSELIVLSGVNAATLSATQLGWTPNPPSAMLTADADSWTGSAVIDRIFAGDGNDVLKGLGANDVLFGEGGNDRIEGGAGLDRIDGGIGNDIIVSLGDGDIIDGGAGKDVLSYAGLARSYSIGVSSSVVSINADRASNVETIVFRDATLTFDADSDAAFVLRLYDGVLGRLPDSRGFDNWTDKLAGGAARTTVAQGFLDSPEFMARAGNLANADFVELLYNQILDRGSDAQGKANWTRALDLGHARVDVLLGFSESPEHKAKTAPDLARGLWTTDNDFQNVEALYHAFADRKPDVSGLLGWTDALKRGVSLQDVAAGFANSAEFTNRTVGLSNAGLVELMYQQALGRAGDPVGKTSWVNALDHGLAKGDLLLGFATSAEHMSKIEYSLHPGVDFLF